MTFDDFAKESSKTTFKIWMTDDFLDANQEASIMADMPNYDDYLKKKKNIQKEAEKITPELRQFYCEPLLSKIQEFHLFRKMNYIKHKTKKYCDWYLNSNIEKFKIIVENYLVELNKVRDLLICCNTRLAAQIIKKRKDYYGQNMNDLISDCFVNIIKAVDGFDYTRGFKFSTYCVWVLMNNSLRDHGSDKKFYDTFSSNLEDSFFTKKIDEKENNNMVEYEHNESIGVDTSKIIDFLKTDYPRESFVLTHYYGLFGNNKKTLKEISKHMGLTKERIRQIRENGIKLVQQNILDGNLSLSYED